MPVLHDHMTSNYCSMIDCVQGNRKATAIIIAKPKDKFTRSIHKFGKNPIEKTLYSLVIIRHSI